MSHIENRISDIENRLVVLEEWRRDVDERLGRIIRQMGEIMQGFMDLNNTERMVLAQAYEVMEVLKELGSGPVQRPKGN